MDFERIRRNVLRMMRRFPSRQAVLLRPGTDKYGQPTAALTDLGTVECWMEGTNRPTRWDVAASGTRFDDEGARWACLLWTEDLPQAKHGDVLRFADGSEYAVKNIVNDVNIRVFWQLADRKEA